jgi:hypothetical protein
MKVVIRRGFVLLVALALVAPVVSLSVPASFLALGALAAGDPAVGVSIRVILALALGWLGLATLIWLSIHFFAHDEPPRHLRLAWLGLLSGSSTAIGVAFIMQNRWFLVSLIPAAVFAVMLIMPPNQPLNRTARKRAAG